MIQTDIDVITSNCGMHGYIKLKKPAEGPEPIQVDDLLAALNGNNITFGIKMNVIDKLAKRPIYGIKIEVARGEEPVDGENGYINYFVKKNTEYQPAYSEEGTIDYKNLDYFQLVKQGQVLCEIFKETKGKEGTNIFGAAVPAKDGIPPASPMGSNTKYNDDGTKLVAVCDGSVNFIKDKVGINEVLRVSSDVDQTTGNITFSGDVMISGNVRHGFSVKSGGNIRISGVVEGASIEAAGDVLIGQGINGATGQKIHIGGDLTCRYIESADIFIEGNISADYIISTHATCHGNIELSGSKGLIVGGVIKIRGDLAAKYIGNPNEILTRIEVQGTEVYDTETINRLIKERDDYSISMEKLSETLYKYHKIIRPNDDTLSEKLHVLRQQLAIIKERISKINDEICKLENVKQYEYKGSIICKRMLYQGVKIFFGNTLFRFEPDNIQHCKIYWHNGEIEQGML